MYNQEPRSTLGPMNNDTPITEKIEEVRKIINDGWIAGRDEKKTAELVVASLIEKPAEKIYPHSKETFIEDCTCDSCEKFRAPKEESSMGWENDYRKKMSELFKDALTSASRFGSEMKGTQYEGMYPDKSIQLRDEAIWFGEALIRAELARQREEIAGEIGKALEPSFLPPIPETNEYANGWNDCRKEARKNRDKLLRFLASIARNHTP